MIKDVSKRIKKESGEFDVLGDILDTLRFRGSIFFRSKLAAPWGMSLEASDTPRFHVALNGDFYIGEGGGDADGQPRVTQIKHMEIAMLPHGGMHWIADQKNSHLTPSSDAGSACELGQPLFQQGALTHKVICGVANYDKQIPHPIIKSLPDVLHFSDLSSDDPIWLTVMIIDAEMHNSHASKTSVIDRLTEVLFLQLLSRYVKDNKQVNGFFFALRNKNMLRTLELIHQFPQNQWTLDSLGHKVGMSRATLVRRFNKTTGTAPMTYLANWRMAKAYHLVKYSSHSSDQIADLVGFLTARTLNKAFQRFYGFTPSQLRRQ